MTNATKAPRFKPGAVVTVPRFKPGAVVTVPTFGDRVEDFYVLSEAPGGVWAVPVPAEGLEGPLDLSTAALLGQPCKSAPFGRVKAYAAGIGKVRVSDRVRLAEYLRAGRYVLADRRIHAPRHRAYVLHEGPQDVPADSLPRAKGASLAPATLARVLVSIVQEGTVGRASGLPEAYLCPCALDLDNFAPVAAPAAA